MLLSLLETKGECLEPSLPYCTKTSYQLVFLLVADIVKAMEACADMTTLRLSGNSLGVGAAEAIQETLAHIPTLRRALWSDMFVSRLKTEIPQALVHAPYS